MTDNKSIDQPEGFSSITNASENILSEVFGFPIHFANIERLSEPDRRNLILRCTSDRTGSFIIKKVEADSYQPDDPDSWETQRFFSDWVGSQFLSSLRDGSNHGPQFYGGSREAGFIILEDLGPHRSLVEPLLHEDTARARAALFRYAARLGQLHASTVNQLDVFDRLWNAVNPAGQPFVLKEAVLEEAIQKLQNTVDGLGVVADANFLQELLAIKEAVMNPGPFLAYIHGDPCPDNIFNNSEELRLIDFEFGHFGHALIDAMYGRMMFPTCWCANRLPSAVVEEMERLYRAELVQRCPEAQENKVFEKALVTICGFWLLSALTWHYEKVLEGDQDWGIASLRQCILARLEAFITTSEQFAHLPAVHGTAGRLLDVLYKRWTDVSPLPLYPAFQGG